MAGPIKHFKMRLYRAVTRGDLAECRRLFAFGEQARAEIPATLSPEEQNEWLICAIEAPADQKELLELLLHTGLDPNSVSGSAGERYLHTPFIRAASRARLDLMQILAARGADIHWSNAFGANAASVA